MTNGTKKVWAYSLTVWIGGAVVATFSSIAAFVQSDPLTLAALVVAGMFALYGIGFGIWAGRTLAKG